VGGTGRALGVGFRSRREARRPSRQPGQRSYSCSASGASVLATRARQARRTAASAVQPAPAPALRRASLTRPAYIVLGARTKHVVAAQHGAHDKSWPPAGTQGGQGQEGKEARDPCRSESAHMGRTLLRNSFVIRSAERGRVSARRLRTFRSLSHRSARSRCLVPSTHQTRDLAGPHSASNPQIPIHAWPLCSRAAGHLIPVACGSLATEHSLCPNCPRAHTYNLSGRLRVARDAFF
jgi:hypothetical protein